MKKPLEHIFVYFKTTTPETKNSIILQIRAIAYSTNNLRINKFKRTLNVKEQLQLGRAGNLSFINLINIFSPKLSFKEALLDLNDFIKVNECKYGWTSNKEILLSMSDVYPFSVSFEKIDKKRLHFFRR